MAKLRKMTSSFRPDKLFFSAFLGPLLIIGGLIVPSILVTSGRFDLEDPKIMALMGTCLVAWALWAAYCYLRKKNLRITASTEGIQYSSLFGTVHNYSWENDKIEVIDQDARKHRLVFKLNDKTVRLPYDASNFAQMRGWLRNHGYLTDDKGKFIKPRLRNREFEVIEVTRLSEPDEPQSDTVLH